MINELLYTLYSIELDDAMLLEEINYYDIVVAIAQMYNNPNISYWQVEKEAIKYAARNKIKLNLDALKNSWKEFTKSKLAKSVAHWSPVQYARA